jgi:hypothetical protein
MRVDDDGELLELTHQSVFRFLKKTGRCEFWRLYGVF